MRGKSGKINSLLKRDSSWPSWVLNQYRPVSRYLRNPEVEEPKVEHSFKQHPIFVSSNLELLSIEKTELKNCVIVSDSDGKSLGELWLRRVFRSPLEIIRSRFICETYLYRRIYNDPLTMKIEGHNNKVVIQPYREFDLFVRLNPLRMEIELWRSNWSILLKGKP